MQVFKHDLFIVCLSLGKGGGLHCGLYSLISVCCVLITDLIIFGRRKRYTNLVVSPLLFLQRILFQKHSNLFEYDLLCTSRALAPLCASTNDLATSHFHTFSLKKRHVNCVCLPLFQGSHSDWKNGKAFSSQAILNRLEKSGKFWKFHTNFICNFLVMFK